MEAPPRNLQDLKGLLDLDLEARAVLEAQVGPTQYYAGGFYKLYSHTQKMQLQINLNANFLINIEYHGLMFVNSFISLSIPTYSQNS